jgi:hypothetical protein
MGLGMDSVLWLYLGAWASFFLTVLFFFLKNPSAYSISTISYFRFLLLPWKITTFLFAAVCLTVIAPYTGDPTWDYVDASFMSILTFITAPWATGILFFSFRKQYFDKQFVLALCLWMFSASWSYDLYLLLRDGEYPNTWFPNIFASSLLYFSAGLLWNLDWREGRGSTFSFLEAEWFAVTEHATFRKIFWMAFPLMLLVTIVIASFLEF